MNSTQVSDLPLPIWGATAGLSSSAKHQKNLPPESSIGYNLGMPLPKPHRKLVKYFDDCGEIHELLISWKMELAVWLKS